LSSRTPS